MPRYAVFACLLAAVVIAATLPVGAGFWGIFSKKENSMDWING